jgi:hypothetical protein
MKLRKLRIAWSLAWGTSMLVLCIFWVRSYYRYDACTWHNGWGTLIDSGGGQLAIAIFRSGDLSRPMTYGFYLESCPREDAWWRTSTIGFGVETNVDFDLPFYIVPYWLPFSVAALCAASPWLLCSFSLRDLLIATTLVGIILGALVVSMRT